MAVSSKKNVPKRGIYAIGDTHFDINAYQEGEDLINRCVEIAKEIQPEVIILLGDILHTHETVKQSAFDQAHRFIQSLAKISKVYVQIGNHDYINHTQFLSDKHFFNPMKGRKNITIVDRPTVITDIEGHQLVSCPYTPTGRLVEALDTLGDVDRDEPINWMDSTCIFAHQEIKGVVFKNWPSTVGDEWPENFPMIISGHIHNECSVGNNVFYTGSSRQVDYTEDGDKKVWHILLEKPSKKDCKEYIPFGDVWIKKIKLNLKTIKEIKIEYEELNTFDYSLTESHFIVLTIKGTSDQFKVFKKSQQYLKMMRHNIKVKLDHKVQESQVSEMLGNLELARPGHAKIPHTFETIFRTLIETKGDAIQSAYHNIIEGSNITIVHSGNGGPIMKFIKL